VLQPTTAVLPWQQQQSLGSSRTPTALAAAVVVDCAMPMMPLAIAAIVAHVTLSVVVLGRLDFQRCQQHSLGLHVLAVLAVQWRALGTVHSCGPHWSTLCSAGSISFSRQCHLPQTSERAVGHVQPVVTMHRPCQRTRMPVRSSRPATLGSSNGRIVLLECASSDSITSCSDVMQCGSPCWATLV
jgi:hypothetical protein